MTKVAMPEPVAFRWRAPIVDSVGNQGGESDWKFGAKRSGLPWWTQDSLITTTQAEAYKDACVREALEPGFDKCFSLLSAWLRSTQAVADMGQVATLTSLVEFALTNQGKTSDQLEAEYQLPASPTE